MEDAAGGRGAAREEAILLATLKLLAESGYDQMTVDAVAAEAHSSKATIYRRWPGKAALVVAAVRRYGGQPEPEAPDSPARGPPGSARDGAPETAGPKRRSRRL